MLIQDRSVELLDQVTAKYQKMIDEVLNNAQEFADKVIIDAKEVATIEMNKHYDQVLKTFETESMQKIAKVRLELEQEKAKGIAKLVESLLDELTKAFENLSKKEKQELIKQMHSRILKRINEHGFKQQDFTINIWSGAKIAGSKSNLDELKVVAESEDVIFEDSVANLLVDERNKIIRVVTRHVDESLE